MNISCSDAKNARGAINADFNVMISMKCCHNKIFMTQTSDRSKKLFFFAEKLHKKIETSLQGIE